MTAAAVEHFPTCPRCGGVIRLGWGWRDRPPTDLESRDFRLIVALEVAVPMWLDLLAGMAEDVRDRHIWWWSQTAIEPIAFRADNLMFGRGKKGEVAEVFNYLASALAALAYSPGGVSFAGRHWCTAPAQEATA